MKNMEVKYYTGVLIFIIIILYAKKMYTLKGRHLIDSITIYNVSIEI